MLRDSLKQCRPKLRPSRIGLPAILALACAGCSPGSTKTERSGPAAQPQAASAQPGVPAKTPTTDASAMSSLTPLLTLQDASSHHSSPLRHASQAPLELALSLPGGDSWNHARLGRAVIRQPDGAQVQLASSEALEALRDDATPRALALEALKPGTSMIIISAGAGQGQRGRDDMANNHYFAKVIVSQANSRGQIPNIQAGVMQKTGQPLELRPVRLPMALQLGDEMAVKLYENQSHRGEATIAVHHPDGQIQSVKTAANGMAFFDVRKAGLHHLRYESTLAGQPAVAELSFWVQGDQGVQP